MIRPLENEPDAVDWCESPSIKQWIADSDEHASAHLPLYDAAVGLLLKPTPVGLNEKLSADCERWRYHVLKRSEGRLSAPESALAHVLDLAANKAAGRAPRLQRRTRQAIADASLRRAHPHDDRIDGQSIREWLASPATTEQLLRRAAERTVETAERTMSLFAPLYLTNHCVDHCPYCWFRYTEDIVRKTLTVDEALREAEVLGEQGARDLLLVAGDYPKHVTVDYLTQIARPLAKEGFRLSVEVASLTTSFYAALVDAGVDGVTLYQETYDRKLYSEYHDRGPKAAYDWRLETLDRAAETGMKRLGLGVLLGLADPVQDLVSLVDHARYLRERFADAQLAFSLPRLHHAPEGFDKPHRVDDEMLVRLYSLLRLEFPTSTLVLSTREGVALRNRMFEHCITRLSAGSKTSPGAYGNENETAGEQFPIEDTRTINEVRSWLEERGYTVE